MFWTAKTQIPVANTSKRCPLKPSLNPAKIPVKEHLRLASVVELSSSGACGAIMGFLPVIAQKISPRIPVNISFKEHLRLASVVVLSSSGDCGGTFPLGLIGGVAVGNQHLWRHLPP